MVKQKVCAHLGRALAVGAAFVLGAGLVVFNTSTVSAQRVLGIDVSAHQTDITAANWATLKRATNVQVNGVFGDGRDFVFIRSSRGGTTGEDHRQGGYPSGNRTFFNLSQRYDDPYFVQNMNRSTTAGFLAGSYHFARPDVVATSTNSDGSTVGVSNTGTDEANHFLQMAGTWMRPGYLLPVLDLEAGQTQRSSAELTTFCIDFANRIYEAKGIRPMVYINGNYANYVQSSIVPALPDIWTARWPNQTDPNSIPVQTGHPKDSYTPIYGPWDDAPNPTHPWKFWQYASTARLNGYANGANNIDVDVAQGGIEFVKDYLVPALWLAPTDGQWTTLTNWNSGQTPIAPVPGPGQLTPIGTQTLPPARLPTSNDTVILDVANTNITVTLSIGTHNIRKLYVREALSISGGSLAVNYVPSWDSTTNGAQFSGAVTLSGSGSLSVHTLQIDATRTFTLAGGTLGFDTLNLMPDSASPARIVMTGNVNFNGLRGAEATIAKGQGSGSSGVVDLGGGTRTFNVSDGAAEVDLSLDVALVNGGLMKTGPGTMRLSSVSGYGGGTAVSAGRLLVNNSTGSGTGAGAVTVNGGILGGTGTVGGVVTVNGGGTLMPGTASSLGTLRLNASPVLNGTNVARIDRNGPVRADRLVLSAGSLNYGGTLVISNVGPPLVGGEVFTNFSAPVYSGSFSTNILPSLNGGLNWYTGGLAVNGTLKVNRQPVPGLVGVSHQAPQVLQIPKSMLTSNAADADGDPIALTGLNMTTTNGVTLTTNGTFIFYSNFVSVADQFTYIIGDGRGGSATGAVQISSSPAGRFTGQPSLNSGALTLHFAGQPGSTYYVERSTNLPTWMTVWTNVAPPSGIFEFTDNLQSPGPSPSSVLYRLRWSP